MKKVIVVMLLVVGCNALLAQTPHTMDTIMGREPTYYYERWFDSVDFHVRGWKCQKELRGTANPTEIAKYNNTDSTLKIIGIAAYAHSQYVPPLPCEPQCADTSFDNWHESLILYKPTDTGMVELASNTYNVRDTSRMMKLYSNMVYGVDSVTIGYYPIYEVYFDEPVIVTDSFYVAATNYNGVVDSQTMTYPGPLAHYAYYSPWASTTLCYPQYYKSRGSYTNYQWAHHYDDWILIIFPIIDTTQPRCWRPTGLSVQAQDSLAVYLAWDTATNNRTWEVAYGRADLDPEAYATLTTVSPECVLTSLDPAVEYAARVRALCYDNTMYSSWTDTVRFTRIGAPLAIDSPTAGRLRLIPNPAHNEITILSDTPVRHFAIYDMQGHTVMSAQADGQVVRVDISTMDKGNYVVHATTTHGTLTSKLTIE